jgi:hypothetical protein
MKTLELIILNILEKHGYTLNSDLTDIDGVIEYLEMVNEDVTPDNVYTPEDWFRDTRSGYPEYLIKKGE